MVFGPGGRYPLDLRPDHPPRRAAIQACRAGKVSSCGFLSFPARPSKLAFSTRNAGMPAGPAAPVTASWFRCHRTTRTDTGFRRLVFSLRGLVGGQDALSTLPLIAAARRSTVRARLTTGTSIIAPSNRTAPNP